MSIQVFGLPVSRGVAIGRAVLVASSRVDVAHYFIDDAQVGEEIERLLAARDAVAGELAALKRDLPHEAPAELPALLDVHLMLVHDELLTGATRQWIVDRHYNAEWALSAQLEVLARQFDEMEDEYLRERKADLEQVVERLLRAMARGPSSSFAPGPAGVAAGPRDFGGEDPLVLVANDIAPADMLQFKRSVFTGFVTDVGGKTSHTAIVARSLNVPAVVATHNGRKLIRENELLIVDGTSNVVIVNPDKSVLAEYRLKQGELGLERAKLRRLRTKPAMTIDGQEVELLANIELPDDLPQTLESGAGGIGLFRSEFLFLNREGLPTEDEQFEAYREVAQGMGGKPVTIRTFDLGADKQQAGLGGLSRVAPNPALGLRAVRFCLAEPRLFLTQLRAILRATHYGNVRILIPMLASVGEIDQTLVMIEQAKESLRERGTPFNADVKVGGMIEIPAAALALPIFMRRLDFLSIGTNDLIQYTLAIDRTDDAVAHLYDPLHPAVLSLVASTIQTATRGGMPVAVCGEMAGDLQLTRLLLGLGLRNFSMHPSQLLAIKERILRTNLAEVQTLAQRVLRASDPAKTRDLLERLNS
jgi:phosphotransferase system enzyme I (PtsI)